MIHPSLPTMANPEMLGWISAIGDRFGHDVTAAKVVATLGVLAAIPLVAWLLYALQRKWAAKDVNKPLTLFRRLLHRLLVDKTHRRMAWRMGRDLKLDNPAILLVSASLFNRHATRWARLLQRRHKPAADEDTLRGLAGALFDSRQDPPFRK